MQRDPNSKIKVGEITFDLKADFQARRSAARAEAAATLDQLRSGELEFTDRVSEKDLEIMFGELGKGNHTHLSPNWRREIIYLIYHTQGTTLGDLTKLVGISPSVIQYTRRNDPVLDQAINDHQAAFYEGMAQEPCPLKPALIAFGLEAKAGWKRRAEVSLDVKQISLLVQEVVDTVCRVVPEEYHAAIAAELERLEVGGERLNGTPRAIPHLAPGGSDGP